MGKFEIRNTIDIAAEEFFDVLFLNEELNERLYREALGFDYELLESDPPRGLRRIRVEPKVELPKMLQKVAGKSLGYVESGQFDRQRQRYDFKVQPGAGADKMSLEGHIVVEPLGADRCVRVTHFDVRVKVFGVGKAVEAFMEKSMRENNDKSAAFLNRHLATRSR